MLYWTAKLTLDLVIIASTGALGVVGWRDRDLLHRHVEFINPHRKPELLRNSKYVATAELRGKDGPVKCRYIMEMQFDGFGKPCGWLGCVYRCPRCEHVDSLKAG